jgi:hypothetical protein
MRVCDALRTQLAIDVMSQAEWLESELAVRAEAHEAQRMADAAEAKLKGLRWLPELLRAA